MPTPTIEIDPSPALKAVADTASPETFRTVMQAAGAEARKAAIDHFRVRELEPEKTAGFPKFGTPFGKRGFWSGNKGTSVAESVGAPEIDPDGQGCTIKIDSPALAHKADENPPPIKPKGGRRFMAIPANARAAAWEGMPRDYGIQGGLVFGYAPTAEGRWMPALVAQENHLRIATRGKRTGQRVLAAEGKATTGIREPQFWLVRSVRTPHDPRALPDPQLITIRCNNRAASVLARLAPN